MFNYISGDSLGAFFRISFCSGSVGSLPLDSLELLLSSFWLSGLDFSRGRNGLIFATKKLETPPGGFTKMGGK